MPPFKVKAVYEYDSPHPGDLLFPNGQIITVTEEEDDDWYVGEYVDDSGIKHEGIFPKNFVEKVEPARPPRPNRKSYVPEQPAAQVAPPTPEVPQQEAGPVPEEQPDPDSPKAQAPPPVKIPDQTKSQPSPLSPTSAHSAKAQEMPQDPPPAPKPAPAEPNTAAPSKKAPPPIAKKSDAFRDRLAMFNQGTTAPQPFKPSAAPSSFIKKPFQAAAPRPDAYIPPPRDIPQVKTYRREEDPEIAERQARDQEIAERAGLSGQSPTAGNEGEEEDQPKVLSLKERMALLQKQQQEQAERAATSHRERKQRPPVKKRTESHGQMDDHDGASLEKVASGEPRERGSIDNARPPRSSTGLKSPDIHANRELLSDANDADQSGAGETEDAEGTSTSVEDDDERSRHKMPSRATTAPTKEPDVGDEQDVEEEEEEEEDEVDAETRRKQELRERMARLGGGFNPMMGGMNPFGAPMGAPLPPKKKKASEKKSTDDSEQPNLPQQRVPMFPGMLPVRSPEIENKQLSVEKEDDNPHPITSSHEPEEVPDVEDVTPQQLLRTPTAEQPPPIPSERRPVPPLVPGGDHTIDRAVPPPVPASSRPLPPHPPIRSPSPGSESGDEISDAPPQSATSPRTPSALPPSKRSSYLASDELSGDSPDKRVVPPIPMGSPPFSPSGAGRPPPPPPPTGAPPSRQPTMDSIVRKVDREGETDYEGDYDTDIASGATHKDALKSHVREASIGDSTLAGDDTPVRSPVTPSAPPPLPPSLPRAVPPPPPPQPPNRASMDAPRGAPPLPPVPPPTRDVYDDDDYDPYNTATAAGSPTAPSMPPVPPPVPQQQDVESEDEDELYAPPSRKSHDRPPPPPPQAPPPQHAPLPPLVDRTAPAPPHDRAAPPPPPPEASQQPRPSMGRKSLDVNRSMQGGRTSMDQPRPSASQEFIASDLDLGASSHWWTQPNMPPPSVQGRNDILYEMDESQSGNSFEKAVFVLYMDYSQTIITARFQANDVSNVHLEQRHDPPPSRLRQDQLEAAHERFGMRIAKDVESKQNTVVGNGTPHGLIEELLRPYSDALKPVGTRAFGALVYANLANASTQQYDEIRPGDIISLRKARFQGKHGAMHAKYSVDVGKPDHVGVVVEWDGKKRKVRVWEQGRESKKVKPESFRMEDLRSGEVRVWRVMARSWVGWS
ncbi:assembly of actin patch protein [Didymosphaeria variabile]|uniref:Assembly of actin patch protein n=1 Tax=Didymosphaeria variabile TaxID=1932322 RepID=A0A9W8XVH2_9PLEO|nr:assembly of actin patch protein [Didymosphaeria variabile]KAJ4359966.1 assembly of actin patch protein [Didymosphaeria variabile]